MQTVTFGPVNPWAATVMDVPAMERNVVEGIELAATKEEIELAATMPVIMRGKRMLTGIATDADSKGPFDVARIARLRATTWDRLELRAKDGRIVT